MIENKRVHAQTQTHMHKRTHTHMHKQTTEGKTEGLPHHLIMVMTFTDARRVLVSLNHPP